MKHSVWHSFERIAGGYHFYLIFIYANINFLFVLQNKKNHRNVDPGGGTIYVYYILYTRWAHMAQMGLWAHGLMAGHGWPSVGRSRPSAGRGRAPSRDLEGTTRSEKPPYAELMQRLFFLRKMEHIDQKTLVFQCFSLMFGSNLANRNHFRPYFWGFRFIVTIP